jgi:plasmid stability protein
MKTTIDLPDDLVRAIKLRALRDGRKLKEAVAELLRQALLSSAATPIRRPTISTDAETGLPRIQGEPGAPTGKESDPRHSLRFKAAWAFSVRRASGAPCDSTLSTSHAG